jgi:thiazole synthase ThiGH ThiG subunit
MHARALANCSGIDSPEEARRLIECGFDALLIGSALLRAADPYESARAFCSAMSGIGSVSVVSDSKCVAARDS